MTGAARLLRATIAGAVFLVGCAAPDPVPAVAERVPIRWQLVERTYGSLAGGAAVGDGRVDPGATVLAFEPVYPEDLVDDSRPGTGRLSVEIVELFPGSEAAPGQPIAATVRVANASPQARYRLRAQALDPGVRLLGERERTVKGSEAAVFRFTSGTLGRRGITVEVEEVDARAP